MKNVILTSLAVAAAISFSPVMAESGNTGGKRASFEELDANGDGNLTMDELQARAAVRFAQADANGDGSLTIEEMVAQANADRAERAQKRAERMIKRMDANGNGTLEAEEIKPSERRAKRMFAKLDTDGSGSISQAEFEAGKGQRRGSKNDG